MPRSVPTALLACVASASVAVAWTHDGAAWLGTWTVQGGPGAAARLEVRDPVAPTAPGAALRVERDGAPGALTPTGTGWWLLACEPGIVGGLAAGAAPGARGVLQLEGGAWSGFVALPDGRRTWEVGRRPGAGGAPEPAFRRHVREAIALNTARRDDYARRSGGRSTKVSRRLVLLERLVLPWAWVIDQRAKRWAKRGVPVAALDFASMHHVAAADAPPRHRGEATDAQEAEVDALLDGLRAQVAHLARAGEFAAIDAAALATYRALRAREAAWGCHWAMSIHVVEQIGFAARNALAYRAATDGATDDLTRHFVRGLRWGLRTAAGLDRDAQRAHAVGVGVLVNDLPEIPLDR